MGRPVVHFEIMGVDAAALRTFYADLFGWTIDASNPMQYGIVTPDDNSPGTAGTSGIGGGIGQLPPDHVGYATFYVDVDDVEAALRRAVELGGARVMGPLPVFEGLTIGMFTDPEGHPVGVMTSTEEVA